jgi:hypothetical protein
MLRQDSISGRPQTAFGSGFVIGGLPNELQVLGSDGSRRNIRNELDSGTAGIRCARRKPASKDKKVPQKMPDLKPATILLV